MAKTIKFNLLLDDNPVRDIESLQNNFCIDDILEVYENGLLEKWLNVRGFDEYLEKVENIKIESSIIVELIKIFDIKKDDTEIRESIYSLEFQENRKKSLENFDIKDDDLKNRIKEYHKEYEELIEAIIEHKENMAFLKVASKEISDKYLKLFELDYKDSYELYKEKSPFMIYAILMNIKLRLFFIQNIDIKQDLYQIFILDTQEKTDTLFFDNFNIFKELKNRSQDIEALYKEFNINYDEKDINNSESVANLQQKIKEALELVKGNDGLIEFKGATDSYWKDLETADTKVMVLSIPNNTFIRSANDLKQELSADVVNGNFLILDGLAYKSNNHTNSIVYMKV